MSISNEIREYASECDRSYVFNYGEMRAFAARLDREMVEFPKDRDGVPIHVGDTVYLDDGRKAIVTRISIGTNDDSVIAVLANGNKLVRIPWYISHKRPDSWETIADELEAWCDDADVDWDACGKPRELADRIRRLAEKEAEDGKD